MTDLNLCAAISFLFIVSFSDAFSLLKTTNRNGLVPPLFSSTTAAADQFRFELDETKGRVSRLEADQKDIVIGESSFPSPNLKSLMSNADDDSNNNFLPLPNKDSEALMDAASNVVIGESSFPSSSLKSMMKMIDDQSMLSSTTTTTVKAVSVTKTSTTKTQQEKTKKKTATKSETVLGPIVLFTKGILGETRLKSLRTEVIKMHSGIITKFTNTSSSGFGKWVLGWMYDFTDVDGNGTIDQEELTRALRALGFNFLNEKDVARIFKRADADGNGTLDFDEWVEQAPQLLKINLTKLAKQNGHDLGMME